MPTRSVRASVMVLGENELAGQEGKAEKYGNRRADTKSLWTKRFEDNFDDIAVQYMFHDIVEDFEKECQ